MEGLPEEATADGPSALRVAIYNGLKNANVDTSTIEGIECFSKSAWFIVFTTKENRNKYRDLGLRIYDKDFILRSGDYRAQQRVYFTYVRIYGFPLDADSEVLKQTLALYGDLNDLSDETDKRINIKTGVKIGKFTKLNENIPSFIYAGRYQVRTAYRNQPKTCRNCQKEGHNAKDCTAGKVCRICGEPGHTKGDCPEKRCYYCHGKGHELNHCDKYVADFPKIIAEEKKGNEQQTTSESESDAMDINKENSHLGKDEVAPNETLPPGTSETKMETTHMWGEDPNYIDWAATADDNPLKEPDIELTEPDEKTPEQTTSDSESDAEPPKKTLKPPDTQLATDNQSITSEIRKVVTDKGKPTPIRDRSPDRSNKRSSNLARKISHAKNRNCFL